MKMKNQEMIISSEQSFAKTNRIYLIISLLLGLSTISCSALNHLQKQSGMKAKRIKLKDLGPSYLEYKDSEFDYFNTKDSEKRLRIKYRRFGFKKYDAFNKKANVLFAKFRVAQKVNQDFNEQINTLLQKGLRGETRRSLRAAIRKRSAKRLKTVQRLENSYDALKLSLGSLRDIVSDAKALVDESKGIVAKTKQEALAKPDKMILADKVTLESKRTVERLFKVINECPQLIKSVLSNLKISEIVKTAKKL